MKKKKGASKQPKRQKKKKKKVGQNHFRNSFPKVVLAHFS